MSEHKTCSCSHSHKEQKHINKCCEFFGTTKCSCEHNSHIKACCKNNESLQSVNTNNNDIAINNDGDCSCKDRNNDEIEEPERSKQLDLTQHKQIDLQKLDLSKIDLSKLSKANSQTTKSCCASQNIENKNISHDTSKENANFNQSFEIIGMDCAACALTVQKAVSLLPNIENVNVNFASSKMTLQADNKEIKQIIKTVENLGYQAFLPNEIIQIDNTNKIFVLIASIFISFAFVFEFVISQHHLANIFYFLTIIFAGFKIFKAAFYSLKAKSIDMNVLLAFAAFGAVFIAEFMEGAMVLFLFQLGAFLQEKALNKTRSSIKDLLDLTPKTATLINGEIKEISQININDEIVVKPGENIALDGIITKGFADINQAAITGESLPVFKQENDEVFAGSLNTNGSLQIKITKIAANSTISHIIKMVEQAQSEKIKSQDFIDNFAKIYTPLVFMLALFIAFIVPIFVGNFNLWFLKGLEILIVACPCALVIAVPVSVVVSLGKASKNGILVKGGNVFDIASQIKAICFDKTGTITKGQMSVVKLKAFNGFNEEQIIEIVASLEASSNHPIAKAVIAYAKTYNISYQQAQITNIAGFGVQSTKYKLGKKEFFDFNINYETTNTCLFIGNQTEIFGVIEIADTLRENIKESLDKLVIDKYLLTGDNANIANKIAKSVSINNVFANMLPNEKLAKIQELQAQFSNKQEISLLAEIIAFFQAKQDKIAFVGDGINDAPALSQADLSIAMGLGEDTAKNVADVVLVQSDLHSLPFFFDLSNYTMKIIKQNIVLSLLVKFIALICIFIGILPMYLAVFADTGVTFLVVLNALRIARFK